ncbi:MAG TPA: hypothetical protein PLK94_06985 [Alphaproteobacteria bacterium]|nr:hypothetical protein [Alphaproteobacteria bacterium]
MKELPWNGIDDSNSEVTGMLREFGLDEIIDDIGSLLDSKSTRSRGRDIKPEDADRVCDGLGRPVNVRPASRKGHCTNVMLVLGCGWGNLKLNLMSGLLDISLLCRKDDGSLTHNYLFIVGTEWPIVAAEEEIVPYIEALKNCGVRNYVLLRAGGGWKAFQI